MDTLLKEECYSSPSIKTVSIQPHRICSMSVSMGGTTHEGYTTEIIIS